MNTYCFILGNNPLLSLAEIFSISAIEKVNLDIIDLMHDILIVSTDKELDPLQWQHMLGGCIKVGVIIKKVKSLKALTGAIESSSIDEIPFAQKDKKIIFGSSMYGNVPKTFNNNLKRVGIELKKKLRAEGHSCRFVTNDSGTLTSVQVVKNKLIERGIELLVISGLHAFYLGKTIGVQDFEGYSLRDYGRPDRDSKSGMLPPKLAKLMVNLSHVKQNDSLFDPFCGSGTVLQEAMLRNIENISGSDISEKAIADTRRNLEWLRKKFGMTNGMPNLYVSDVKHLQDKIPSGSIDVIVTEPYLGPPLRKELMADEMVTLVKELEQLYIQAFTVFKSITKPTSRIVMVFPLFKTIHGIYVLKILEELESLGFIRINPIPEKMSLFAKIGPTARGSLIYQRSDQRVQREIFIFERKKAEA